MKVRVFVLVVAVLSALVPSSAAQAAADPTVEISVAFTPVTSTTVMYTCVARAWNYEEGAVAVATTVRCNGLVGAAPGMVAATGGVLPNAVSGQTTVCASGSAVFSDGSSGSGGPVCKTYFYK